MEQANWHGHFRSRLERLPRLDLGVFPTAVRSIQLGSGSIWVKDDGACCDLYGGNKVRKLEYFLADARRRGTRQLVVWGDPDSHTIMASALLGRRCGFNVEAVVFPCGKPAAEDACTGRIRQSGATVRRVPNMLLGCLRARWSAWRSGGQVIPLGCSSPVSTVGYARAVVELDEQVRQGLLPMPRKIFVAFGSGGTVAGLLLGLWRRAARRGWWRSAPWTAS